MHKPAGSRAPDACRTGKGVGVGRGQISADKTSGQAGLGMQNMAGYSCWVSGGVQSTTSPEPWEWPDLMVERSRAGYRAWPGPASNKAAPEQSGPGLAQPRSCILARHHCNWTELR